MSLKDIYYKLEDYYFRTLDKLEDKGINIYKVIDPLEKKGIPTFLIFLLIATGLIVLLIFGLITSFGLVELSQSDNLVLTFQDEARDPIVQKEISFNIDEKTYRETTDSKGKVELDTSNFNEDQIYTFSLNTNQFNFESTEALANIDLSKKRAYTYTLSENDELINKKIIFKNNNNELIEEQLDVSFSCSENTDFSKIMSTTTGEIDLEIPSDCGVLIPNISNINYNLESSYNIETSNQTEELFLSGAEEKYGHLRVSLLDKDSGVGVENIEVQVYNLNDILVDSAVCNNNGQIVFENLPLDTYKIYTKDPNNIYSSISSLDYTSGDVDAVSIVENTTTDFELHIKKDIVGFVNLKIEDIDTKEAIENVEVKLNKGSELIFSGFTDSEGKINFGVRENTSYKVLLDHKDYVIKQKVVSSKTNPQEVQNIGLRILDQTTLQGVFVSVVDKDKNPVEFATIKVINSSDDTIVKTLSADVRGQAEIANLNTDIAYQLEASTGQYSGKTNPFFVKEREPQTFTIPLEIGEGTYNLSVVDNVGQPVSTNVSVVDLVTNQELTHKKATTDNEGNTLIRLRADRVVYFVIDNYDSKYMTKRYNVKANTTIKETINLPAVSNNSNMTFVGLYNAAGDVVSNISSGQAIKARFILNVGSNYSRVQAHIRTGEGIDCDGKTHSIEQDSLYIKEVNFAGNKVLGSSTFTPCKGEAKDMSSLTKRDGKWFNAIIDNPIPGSYLIEADLVIKDTATGNLPLYYRSEFQEGNVVKRFPEDTILGNSLTSSDKQGLYAYSKDQTIYTGASTFCTNELCYYFSVMDKTNNITKTIIDKYNAKANTEYDLAFRFSFDKSLSNAALNIERVGSSLQLNDYLITTAGSKNIKGEDFTNIDLGNMSVNDHISGKINLNTLNDQSDSIKINLLSNGEVVFTKKINFDISASKELNAEITPDVLVPFINNDVIVSIYDDEENVVDRANITIKHNSNTIVTGMSGKSGIFAFTLPSPNLGDVIDIIIRKQGYKTVNLSRKITNDLITTNPEELNINLNLSNSYFTTYELSLFNKTILPLAIENISTNINSEFVDIEVATQDILLQPSQDVPLKLKVSVTPKGLNLLTQKMIDGEILIKVNDSTLNKTWVVKVPLTIRITFGNGVDNLDCLTLIPDLENIRLDAQESYDFDVEIENTCTVDNYPIALNNVNAEIEWGNSQQIGDFYIINNNEEIKLESNNKKLIFKNLENSITNNFKIRFDSFNVSKATALPKIVFTNRRANINGVDEISSIINTNIVVNNYTSCLSIPKQPVTTIFCPINNLQFNNNPLMNNMYNNNFGYDTMAFNAPQYSSYMQYQQNFSNPNNNSIYTNYPGTRTMYNQMMGASNYLEPENMQNLGMQNSSMYMCPQTSVPIKNNCAEDLSIKVDSSHAFTIQEDSEFVIEKDETKYLRLQGGSQFGTFNMSVRAKPNVDSISNYTLVGDVPVLVMQPVSEIPRECIIVNPTTFDFSGIADSAKEFSVINTCVSQGWNLQNIALKSIEKSQFKVGGDAVNFFSFSLEESQTLRPIKKEQNLRNSEGDMVERWTFKVQRDPNIREYIINMRQNQESPARWVSALRNDLLNFGDVMTLEAVLSINYRTPRNELSSTEKILELTDNLKLLGFLDQTTSTTMSSDTSFDTSKGASFDSSTQKPSTETQKIIDSLVSKSQSTPQELVSGQDVSLTLNKDDEGYVLNIKFLKELQKEDFLRYPSGLSKCFYFDVEDLKNKGLKDISSKSELVNKGTLYNGEVSAQLNPKKEGEIELCLYRQVNELSSDSAKINSLFFNFEDQDKVQIFKIINPRFWFISDKVLYPNLRINLELDLDKSGLSAYSSSSYFAKDIDVESSSCYDPKGFTKDSGLTGISNVKKYGFNKLLFEWDSENISDSTFDLGKYYADQDQLRMSIDKKIKAEHTLKIDNIKFILNSESGSIKSVKNVDLNIDCSFCKSICSDLEDMDEYLDCTFELLEEIPENLSKFTIVKFSKDSLSKEDFEELINSNNNDLEINNYTTSCCDLYQTNLVNFKKLLININEKIDSMSDKEISSYRLFLEDIRKTMDLYYGVGANEFIVNIKDFGNINNSDTESIFKDKSLFSSNSTFNIVSDDDQLGIGAYYVKVYVLNNPEDSNYNLVFKPISEENQSIYNPYKDSKDLKNNLFFKYPINASVYNLANMPFSVSDGLFRKNSNLMNAKVYDDYEAFEDIQDGYVFSFVNNDTQPSLIFKDITPLQVVSDFPFVYNYKYVVGDEYKILGENGVLEDQEWLGEYDDKREVFKTTVDKKDYTFALTKRDNKNTVFKNTYFILNEVNTDLDHQVEISSSIDLKTSSNIYAADDSDNYKLLRNYKVSKNFKNNLEIIDIINGISENKICFNLENNNMNFWINPINPNME